MILVHPKRPSVVGYHKQSSSTAMSTSFVMNFSSLCSFKNLFLKMFFFLEGNVLSCYGGLNWVKTRCIYITVLQ